LELNTASIFPPPLDRAFQARPLGGVATDLTSASVGPGRGSSVEMAAHLTVG